MAVPVEYCVLSCKFLLDTNRLFIDVLYEVKFKQCVIGGPNYQGMMPGAVLYIVASSI